MNDFLEIYLSFFDKGGQVLTVILFTSSLMWVLILERYWYFLFGSKDKIKIINKQWQARKNKNSWYSHKIRNGLIAEIAISARKNLLPISTLIAILPLLGLLGTVTGMISIFEVMSVFGTGNARGMADGISRALLPTTAGLVTSIAGLYFSNDLNRRARAHTDSARDLLTE